MLTDDAEEGARPRSPLGEVGLKLHRFGAAVRGLEGYEFWLFIFSTAILPFAVYTSVGDWLEWEDRRHKTPADWAHDLVSCIMWCSFLFTARGGRKVHLHWLTVIATLATSLGWGFVSELKVFQHSLADVSKWGFPMWLAIGTALAAVIVGGIFHVIYAWQHKRMFSIVYRPLILAVVFAASTAIVSLVQNNTYGMPSTMIHFHHYQFSLLLAMSCILPTWWSRILQGICLGLFTNGIAAYGTVRMRLCCLLIVWRLTVSPFFDAGQRARSELGKTSMWRLDLVVQVRQSGLQVPASGPLYSAVVLDGTLRL
jgi:hypothetical protein